MIFTDIKMELAFPVFLGCAGALILCALIMIRGPFTDSSGAPGELVLEAPKETRQAPALVFFAGAGDEDRDYIREMYREPELQNWVIDFFTGICVSREITEVILANADAFDIPPALAFALSWEESRFNPLAVNSKNRDESIDRGLFQLNNRSFPAIETQAFFKPQVNAWYGMGHLRHCLNTGGSEIAALAMYNAGTGKVRAGGTPKTTLDYINRIMANRRKIEIRFQTRLRQEAEVRFAGTPAAESPSVAGAEQHIDLLREALSAKRVSAAPAYPRFVRLAPLAGGR